MSSRMVIKIGGQAFEGATGFRELAAAIRALPAAEVMIVHGGGKEISAALTAAGRETVFIDGIRVTRAADIEIVEKVLSDTVNARIASQLTAGGVACQRMSGKTDGLFQVVPLRRNGRDIGYVGRIRQVHAAGVRQALQARRVPVISPVSGDDSGQSYNVNADSAASALAVATRATDLVYLTDVPGVHVNGQPRPRLTVEDAHHLIADRIITGGMVAKMESAFEALGGGVTRVYIARWDGPETLNRLRSRGSETATVIES